MHKILITDPRGVVINTKHHATGEILLAPPGIAKGILHFKQGKEVEASEVRTRDEVAGGTPAQDFTRKLRIVLLDDFDLTPQEATHLIESDHATVTAGIPGGDAALQITAVALLRGGFASNVLPLAHPAARLIQYTGGSAVGPMGALAPEAPAPGGAPADQPTPLQQANTDATGAEINAAAVEKKGHKKGK